MHFYQPTWAFPQMNDQEALHALPHHHWFHAQALKMLIGHVFYFYFVVDNDFWLNHRMGNCHFGYIYVMKLGINSFAHSCLIQIC
jgi:hypothetical protein